MKRGQFWVSITDLDDNGANGGIEMIFPVPFVSDLLLHRDKLGQIILRRCGVGSSVLLGYCSRSIDSIFTWRTELTLKCKHI
jgi:hypothetical protein